MRRPNVVDIEQVPQPTSTIDVFDTFPTLTLARRATLERMKAAKLVSIEDEYYLNQEAEEFDQEVQRDFDDAFGSRESMERHERAEMLSRNVPDVEPIDDLDRIRMPGSTRRRTDFDDVDQNLI